MNSEEYRIEEIKALQHQVKVLREANEKLAEENTSLLHRDLRLQVVEGLAEASGALDELNARIDHLLAPDEVTLH